MQVMVDTVPSGVSKICPFFPVTISKAEKPESCYSRLLGNCLSFGSVITFPGEIESVGARKIDLSES